MLNKTISQKMRLLWSGSAAGSRSSQTHLLEPVREQQQEQSQEQTPEQSQEQTPEQSQEQTPEQSQEQTQEPSLGASASPGLLNIPSLAVAQEAARPKDTGQAFLTRAPLSFFDDFRSINGVPAFILGSDEESGGGDEDGEEAALTCSCMSADGERFLTGDSRGVLRLWDTNHGKLLSSYQGPTGNEISVCAFLDGGKDVILGADSEGMVWMFELESSQPVCEPIACNSAALHLCEHYEGANAVQEALNPDTSVPRLYPPVFSRDGRKVAQVLSMRTSIRNLFPEIHVFVHSLLDSPTELPLSMAQSEPNGLVSGGRLQMEVSRSLMSDCKFSPNGEGLMVVCAPIPPNEHYEGRDIEKECHVIVWPDLNYPLLSSMLPGRMGQWSPDSRWVLTWTLSEEGITDKVRMFSPGDMLTRMMQRELEPISDTTHPHFCSLDTIVELIPGWPNLKWCEVIPPHPSARSNTPHTVASGRKVDLTGWRLAACIGVPEDSHIRVVIWDLSNLAKIHVLDTGVSFEDTLVSARYFQKLPEAKHLEWGMRCFNLEKSLCMISVSPDTKWISFYSSETNTGFLWELDWGVPVLSLKFPQPLLEDKWTTSHLATFDSASSRLLLSGHKHMILFVPSCLVVSSLAGPQMRTALDKRPSTILSGVDESNPLLSLNGTLDSIMGEVRGLSSKTMDKHKEPEAATKAMQYDYEECALSCDGSVVAVRGLMGTLFSGSQVPYGPMFWKVRKEAQIDHTHRYDSPQCFALSRSGEYFAVFDSSSKITVGKTDALPVKATNRPNEILHDVKWRLSSMSFYTDKDGNEVLVAFSRQRRGMLFWFDTSQLCERHRKDAGLRQCRSIRYCHDGTRAVITNLQNILIWDLVGRTVLERIDFKVNMSQAQQTLMFKMMSGGSSGAGLSSDPLLSADGSTVVLMWDTVNSQPVVCHPTMAMAELEEQVVKSSGTFASSFTISEDARWSVVAEAKSPDANGAIEQCICIYDMWNRCPVRVLRDWKYSSSVPQTFAVSSDGRCIVSKSLESKLLNGIHCPTDDLICWTPYSCEDSLPDYQRLSLNKRSRGCDIVEELLAKFGWCVVNCGDWQGMSIFAHSVIEGNLMWVTKMLKFAKAAGVPVGMHWLDLTSRTKISALRYAIEDRSLDIVKALVEGILDGSTTCFAAADMFKESLMTLGKTFPSIFKEILEENKISEPIGKMIVPVRIFDVSSSKYIVGTDDDTPEWKEMNETELFGLWRRMHPSLDAEMKKEGPRVEATSSWVVHADIARVGMVGIIRPLLFYGFPNEIYGFHPVRWTIEYKWRAYAGRQSVYFMLRYCGLATLFSIYACILAYELRHELEGMISRDWYNQFQGQLAIGSLVGATILALNHLRQEFRQVYRYWKDGKKQGLIYWASSYWNWMDLVSYVLVLIVAFIEFTDPTNEKFENLGILVSIGSVILWSKMLYYGQAFQMSGAMVIMIVEIVKDMMVFSILCILVIIGFGIAFFVLFNLDPGPLSDDTEVLESRRRLFIARKTGDYPPVNEGFRTLPASLMSMFTMMLGEFDLEVFGELEHAWLAKTFFVIYMLVVLIVLLNLLIAIMGDTFDRVKGTENTQFLLGRAGVIDDIDSMLSDSQIKDIEKKIGKYLHVLELSDGSQDLGGVEWQGRVLEMEKRIRRVLDEGQEESAATLKDEMKTLREEMKAMFTS